MKITMDTVIPATTFVTDVGDLQIFSVLTVFTKIVFMMDTALKNAPKKPTLSMENVKSVLLDVSIAKTQHVWNVMMGTPSTMEFVKTIVHQELITMKIITIAKTVQFPIVNYVPVQAAQNAQSLFIVIIGNVSVYVQMAHIK